MSSYLASHPGIFMTESSGIKEPKFFCSDLWYRDERHPKTWCDYIALYRNAPATAVFLGEATPRYLSSSIAVENIQRVSPDARYVVMLRNPVDLVISQHNQRVKRGEEQFDLETAWRLQPERLTGRRLPPSVADGRILQYAAYARLGAQVERLYDKVDRKRVHITFFDDLRRNPRREYLALLMFLGLPDDGRMEFQKKNPSVIYRSKALERAMRAASRVKRQFGIRATGVHSFVNKFNSASGHDEISPQLRNELREYFREDVTLLSKLTGRDLSAWQ